MHREAIDRRLVMRAYTTPDGVFRMEARIESPCEGPVEVMKEGWDETVSPLRRPVHWRIERRGSAEIFCSCFAVTRQEVLRAWGPAGLELMRAGQNTIDATIETREDSDDLFADGYGASSVGRVVNVFEALPGAWMN